MSPPVLVEVFLLVPQPRQRVTHWLTLLAPLSNGPYVPYYEVALFYAQPSDTAYLRLRYDERQLGRGRLAFVFELAQLAEIRALEPSAWPTAERTRFLQDRISACTEAVHDCRTIAEAMTELVRRHRTARERGRQTGMSSPQITVAPVAASRGLAAASIPPSPGLSSPPGSPPAPPVTRTNGSPSASVLESDGRVLLDEAAGIAEINDEVSKPIIEVDLQAMAGRAGSPLPLLPAEESDAVRRMATTPYDAAGKSAAALLADVPHPGSSAADATAARVTQPHASVRGPQRGMPPRLTSEVRGTQARATATPDVAEPRASQSPVHERADSHNDADARAVTDAFFAITQPALPSAISARFLRGGRWLAARVGSLSLRGAYILTGALPRSEDNVHIALGFGEHAALVRGRISRIDHGDEQNGTSGFAVEFDLDHAATGQLTALLLAARAAQVTIKAPPARGARRLPVQWPVCFGTARGPVRADALDVSQHGMFVVPVKPIEAGANLSFSAVLEDGGAPIVGRARVVRHVTEEDARRRALMTGFGLEIADMNGDDKVRWRGFLARVAMRCEKRILVGAAPERVAEITATLAGAGYAVTGGSDAEAFVQLAESDRRPVDAAVIDATWAGGGAQGAWIAALLKARNVPCVTSHGDGKRARAAVDKLLQVRTP